MIRDTDTSSGAREKLTFEYDYMGRRIRKQFYTYSSGWVLQSDSVFLYDGWNLLAELDAANSSAKLRTYIWGTDLSGSMQGAGGIGGLVKVTDYASSTTHQFVAYDGNGNVGALLDSGTGALTAKYEYGPFAEPLRATGSMAKKNPLRFSTKFADNETGLLYFRSRHYQPSGGRWLARDLANEPGFELVTSAPTKFDEEDDKNLYNFLSNDPVNRNDHLSSDAPGGKPPGKPIVTHKYRFFRWSCICTCRIGYIDHHKTHTALEKAYFEAEEDHLRDRLAAACKPHNQPAFQLVCDQMWQLYKAYY